MQAKACTPPYLIPAPKRTPKSPDFGLPFPSSGDDGVRGCCWTPKSPDFGPLPPRPIVGRDGTCPRNETEGIPPSLPSSLRNLREAPCGPDFGILFPTSGDVGVRLHCWTPIFAKHPCSGAEGTRYRKVRLVGTVRHVPMLFIGRTARSIFSSPIFALENGVAQHAEG
jgi:hypothetical protein